MPPVLAKRTLGLPRWVWATMLGGGLVLGLYLRSRESGEETEDVAYKEHLNSGNVQAPAPPIEGGGGGVAGIEVPPKPNPNGQPPGQEWWQPPITLEVPPVELPESPPPSEEESRPENPAPPVAAEQKAPPPIVHETIQSPTTPHVSPAQDLGAGGGGQGPGSEGHPQAVRTANQCVRGGVGGHTAPPGYHLYCGGDGYIWRAPNS